VRRALVGCGLDEAITYAFIGPDAVAALGLPEGDVRLEPVRLSNPMSVEQSVMRTTLVPGLLQAVRENIDRLNDPPDLFELGRVYLWDEQAVEAPAHAAEPGAVLPHEPEALGIVLAGALQEEHWAAEGRRTDFYTLKGVVETMLDALHLSGEFAPLGEAADRYPYLHPGKAAVVASRAGSSASSACCGPTSRPSSASTRATSTSPNCRSSASARSPCGAPTSATSAPTRRPPRTSPSWSAATSPPPTSWRSPGAPAASSRGACASSTCTRAGRSRPTSARSRCAS
jgi:hypothetical protein